MNQSIARTIMARFNDKRRRAVVNVASFNTAATQAAQPGQEWIMLLPCSFWYSSGKSQQEANIITIIIISQRRSMEIAVDAATETFRCCRSLELKSMY
jgi:hypothetical protein